MKLDRRVRELGRFPTRSKLKVIATYLGVLARNRFRRWQWDRLTSSRTTERVKAQCLDWQEKQLFLNVRGHSGDPRLDAAVDRESTATQLAYVCRYAADCVIEPRYGYVIEKPLRLIDLSMPYSEWARDPRYRHIVGFPSVVNIAAGRLGLKPIRHEDRVISLRFYWENNYFHFLADILPRLKMANEFGVPNETPVVVGRHLAAQKFFRSSFPNGTIDGRRIIEQGDTFIAANEVVFARPLTLSRDNLVYVADLLGAPREPRGQRRIFLTRSPARGRNILNQDEVLPVVARFGLEVLDTDGLTVAEQVDLFASAELVVGIHGAGLGNLIFRRNAPCTLLEIFPPQEESVWFPWLANQLGFTYDAISGYTDVPVVHRMQSFSVDPRRLEAKLERVINGLQLGRQPLASPKRH